MGESESAILMVFFDALRWIRRGLERGLERLSYQLKDEVIFLLYTQEWSESS